MSIIITGASRGIGRAVAEKFCIGSAPLLLCARNKIKLAQTATELMKDFPSAVIKTYAADLSKKTEVVAFADWCLTHGTPAVLVNNAGTYLPGNISDEAEGALEMMIDTNLYSAYYLSRKLLPAMVAAGSGHIFNICSVAALKAYEGGGGYSISKFALHGFTANLRHELKGKSIKVTGVYPGAVLTDSWAGYDNTDKRIMEASDIASMIFAATQLSQQAVVEDIIIRPQLGDL